MTPKLIYADGRETEVLPDDGKNFSLHELQTLVGGYIELVQLNDGRCMVIDEDGKLKGLDLNERATRIFSEDGHAGSDDVIVGNALVCDQSFIE